MLRLQQIKFSDKAKRPVTKINKYATKMIAMTKVKFKKPAQSRP